MTLRICGEPGFCPGLYFRSSYTLPPGPPFTAKKIRLATPRGFGSGVDRAIEIVERALQLFGAPIYVRHEVVHNRHVVERLRDLGTV